MTILITGATGNIGGEVIEHLLTKNVPIRGLVRDRHKAAKLKERGIELVEGDFLHPDTLEAACQGIEKALLVTANDPRQVEMESNFVDAAKRSGVHHVVKISVLRAGEIPSTFQQWHRQVEQRLEESGMAWTHLRPNMLMQNMRWFAQTIAQQSAIYNTVGDTKISHVDARDVAAVAAICLIEPGHENKIYTLTGAEAIAFDEVAEKFSQALNRPVQYINIAPPALKQARMANGEPEWYLDAELQLFASWAQGMGSLVSSDIAEVTQKPAISFDEFAQYYAKTRAIDFFNVERVATGFTFLEGPVYDVKHERLLFCDAQADTIYSLFNNTVDVFYQPSGNASGLAFDPQGRLVVCNNRDRAIVRIEPDGRAVKLAERFEGKRFNSPNDLAIRSDNTIYFSDPPYGLPNMSEGRELSFNGVYKISPSGELSLAIQDLPLPNGLVFSPDEQLLYINESQTRTIRCFDVNSDGTLANGRIFAQLIGDRQDWVTDGIAIDAQGSIYCAGPKGVWVFSASGELQDRIYAPEVITNLAWGDPDYKTLYLTGITSLYRIRRSIGGRSPAIQNYVNIGEIER